MNLLLSFLSDNLIYIYFVYGLAFFVLGFAISLAPKPQLPSLATSLRYLGAFGVTHGLAEWAHVFDLAGRPAPGFVHIALLLAAGFFLLQFGARMFTTLVPSREWMRQLPLILLIVWGLGVTTADLFAVQTDVVANAEMLIHYLLFFPGSALAAWAFLQQGQRIETPHKSLRQDMRLAVVFFVLHALTCGIFMAMEYSPTLAMIDPMRMSLMDMALLVVRTALAVGATFLFLSMLRTFETQRVKELEEAQHAKLEAQEQARQAAEQRSRELAEEKGRTESLYHSVLENANDAIFIHDLTGRFLEVNRTACERLGYSRDELLRMGVQQLDTPEMAAHFDDGMRLFAEKGSAVGETCHVRKDGSRVPTEISARLIDFKGQPAVLSVARDIRERKQVQAEIERRNQELDDLYHETAKRAEQIAVSNEIIRTISSGQTIGEMFQTFAEQTRKLVPYSRMGIALIDHATGTMTFQRRFLEDGVNAQPGLTYPIAGTPVEQIIQTRQPWLCPDVHQERRYPQAAKSLLELELESSIIVPIIWKTDVLGTLNLHHRLVNTYGEKEARLLEPIAGQLAIALKNAQFQNQIHDMAIRAERERLGRELHDGLGQALGYFRMKVGEVIELLHLKQIEEAQHVLTELNENSQIAYADVREAILGLRATVTAGTGLESALREYLHRYQREWGIHTELIAEGVDQSCVAPSVEIQLLRIVQEALTNVRKHAQAKNARVRFEYETERILVTIEDDGCGFAVNEPRREYFGLQTMRERAESVGGSFAIESVLRKGTRVHVSLPYHHDTGSRT